MRLLLYHKKKMVKAHFNLSIFTLITINFVLSILRTRRHFDCRRFDRLP